MQVDLPNEAIKLLQQILPVLSHAAALHENLHEDDELIEPWTPSDWDNQIDCPELTVGLLRKADRLKQLLKM